MIIKNLLTSSLERKFLSSFIPLKRQEKKFNAEIGEENWGKY